MKIIILLHSFLFILKVIKKNNNQYNIIMNDYLEEFKKHIHLFTPKEQLELIN